MGFRLWDREAKKIVCNHSVFFNEEKMHKKPVKIVEVRRVIFQEDGHENAREQQQVAQRQEEVRVREDEQVVEAQPIVRWSTRVSRPPDRFVPSLDYVMLTDCKETSCYDEAMLRDNKLK